MARWGNCDYKQLQQLRENLTRLQSMDLDKFCRDASKELAARLLRLVIPATPLGDYPKGSGKKGGTLRRGWTTSSTGDSAHDTKQAMYENLFGGAQRVSKASMQVDKVGNTYTIEIINPVEYASYVEYGHRTANGKGWVPGRYFLTLSEEELRRIAPAVLERKLEKLLREVFNV